MKRKISLRRLIVGAGSDLFNVLDSKSIAYSNNNPGTDIEQYLAVFYIFNEPHIPL
jgi:hypothetical protein